MANLIRALSKNGGVTICAVDSTNIVREMERVHKPSATVSAALGRVLTAGSLMATWLKNKDDSLTVQFKGDGPVGSLLAVSDGDGNVRGYALHPEADMPPRPDGKLDVAGVVGKNGVVSVVKDLGLKEPYIGQVPIVSGEIAEDITSYYATSEQVPTVCALGVLVNPDLSIQIAGGFLLQLLPGASEGEIARLEQNVAKLPPITALLQEGLGAVIDRAMEGFEPEILDRSQVEYRCYCSEEKTERILISLGKEELLELQAENPVAEVACHFCDKKYHIAIDKILAEIS